MSDSSKVKKMICLIIVCFHHITKFIGLCIDIGLLIALCIPVVGWGIAFITYAMVALTIGGDADEAGVTKLPFLVHYGLGIPLFYIFFICPVYFIVYLMVKLVKWIIRKLRTL
ncbi:hypothetical protein E4665_02350 [Sporolactobacillus shoreae]|uniref:Uncharacterized protein n=1 Tax=Sporolactobacillus shoreae TaxID=1465501 RepID=A0A4Z0GR58_9BACL|nr:hypothetical protein [Sporolactobacillus shoreae]TGA99809.1 hypothetical protein E4665_02350 [Sporolactobacillus shoreae]